MPSQAGKMITALAKGTLAILSASIAVSSSSQTTQVAKGRWQGPTRHVLPGPGPTPGQSLEDYFAELKTGPRVPSPPHILVLGGSRGFHHDSISTAMAAIFDWGQRSGAYEAELRTDFDLVNPRQARSMNAGFQPIGLGDFDAVIVVSVEGDWGLTEEQKSALLAFVHDRGKGLVVMHAGLAANKQWPDWIDMIGGEMTGHPFNTLERPIRPFAIRNEDRDHPATRRLAERFIKQDELYVIRNFSRSDTHVLLSLDKAALDTRGIEDQLPPDMDIPIAWSKNYGRGRVFVSSLGHTKEAYKDDDIATFYYEGIRWALGLVDD